MPGRVSLPLALSASHARRASASARRCSSARVAASERASLSALLAASRRRSRASRASPAAPGTAGKKSLADEGESANLPIFLHQVKILLHFAKYFYIIDILEPNMNISVTEKIMLYDKLIIVL